MKLFDNERDVLPSWVTSQQASGLPELNSIKVPGKKIIFEKTTPQIAMEFQNSQTVGVAVELLNVAIIENENAVARMAASFLSKETHLPKSVCQLIDQVLGVKSPIGIGNDVHTISGLKQLLKKSPNDPLVWADLSREYAILGEKDKSIKAMLGALHAGVNHRWLTRIAARVFVHFDEPDRAHSLVLRNENVKSDPWLIATEMAVSRKAEKQSKLLLVGKKFLESNIKPKHLSELASSFATLELRNGAEKKAKKLFKQSLVEPNQNSLAQAKWAERSSGLKNLVQVPLDDNVVAYEAQYWEAYNNKEILSALQFAKSWYRQEPYSSGPTIAISYLASLLDNYDLVTRVTNKGLIANPQNLTLKLNQIFAWIASTDLRDPSAETVAEAEQIVRDLESITEQDDWSLSAHAIANLGMLSYRCGDLSGGRQRYEIAEEIYEKYAPELTVVLQVNHLREALIAESPWASEIMGRAKSLMTNRKSSATPGAEFYLEKISNLSVQQGSWLERFNSEAAKASLEDETEKSPRVVQKSSDMSSLSKFWLPDKFSHIESLQDFTNSAGVNEKRPKR
jgi:hypothetical protein